MIKKILLAILLFAIFVIIGGFAYLQTLRPTYNGNMEIHGIKDNVEVYFDKYGIPHIYAQSDPDAWHALGYVHAQDRLWQMELLRRIGSGRLSEFFGSSTLQTDKLFKTLGIHQYSIKSADRFTANAPQDLQDKVHAYLSGINQFIDEGPTPIELHLIGGTKSHFNLVDIYNTLGYMSFSFGIAHRTEPIMSYIKNTYGNSYLQDLDIETDSIKQIIDSYPQKDLSAISIEMNQLLNQLPAPSFMGSNSWVIGPSKTASGKVIFANDPHIGYAQPAVWYEAHIETPTTKLYGYYLAGAPVPQMGHTDRMAIGLTMLLNDDTDLYYEKIEDDKYKYNNEWLPVMTRQDTIKIRNNDDHILTIQETIHGPVVNNIFDAITNDDPVSFWWSYINSVNYTLEGAHELLTADTLTEVAAGASKIHAPGLNVMYGDREGNVAWWATAKLVKRNKPEEAKFIHDGTTNQDEPIGYYPFEANPSSINPPSGYVYSANNQTRSNTGVFHEGYYVPENRAKKIVSLLEEKNDWTIDEVKEMTLDVNSLVVPVTIKNLLGNIDNTDLSDGAAIIKNELLEWDGTFSKDGTNPTMYVKLISDITEQIFMDEIGASRFATFIRTPICNRSLPLIIGNDASVWWDNVKTKNKIESKNDIATIALENTYSQLKDQLGENIKNWKWEKVHTLEHEHALGKVSGLKSYFNVGPFPIGGWDEVINNMHTLHSTHGKYSVHAGPSTRRIVDFADIENNSWSISPTGQSGNPMSPFYNDQAEMFIQGQFRKQKMNKEEILSESKNKLTFSPK